MLLLGWPPARRSRSGSRTSLPQRCHHRQLDRDADTQHRVVRRRVKKGHRHGIERRGDVRRSEDRPRRDLYSFSVECVRRAKWAQQHVTISPAAASQLVIQIQPSPVATAGQAITTQPVIDEEDRIRQPGDGHHTTVITAEPDGFGSLLGAAATSGRRGESFSSLANETAESVSISFHAGGLNSFPTNPSHRQFRGG